MCGAVAHLGAAFVLTPGTIFVGVHTVGRVYTTRAGGGGWHVTNTGDELDLSSSSGVVSYGVAVS